MLAACSYQHRWRKTTRILQTKLDEQRSKRLKVAMRVSLVSQLFGANKRFALSATRLAACSRQGPTFSALSSSSASNFRLIGSVPYNRSVITSHSNQHHSFITMQRASLSSMNDILNQLKKGGDNGNGDNKTQTIPKAASTTPSSTGSRSFPSTSKREDEKEPGSEQLPVMNQLPVKKLTSSKPDLTIFLGTESKPFHCHSAIMASHSGYIDTMLVSPMLESKSLEIRFPYTESEVWLKIIALLEDPILAREMTVQEAMQFAPIYSMYDFRKGCQLCSHVLADYIEKKQPTLDLNLRVDIFLLADRLRLEQAYKVGLELAYNACVASFRKYFVSPTIAIVFTEDQLRKLAPIIAKERNLLVYMNSTKKEVLSPLWPQNFVLKRSLYAAERTLQEATPQIRLSGSSYSNGRRDFRP